MFSIDLQVTSRYFILKEVELYRILKGQTVADDQTDKVPVIYRKSHMRFSIFGAVANISK